MTISQKKTSVKKAKKNEDHEEFLIIYGSDELDLHVNKFEDLYTTIVRLGNAMNSRLEWTSRSDMREAALDIRLHTERALRILAELQAMNGLLEGLTFG